MDQRTSGRGKAKPGDKGSNFWKPPELGSLKLNSDAGVFPNGSVGLGFVVRNAEGRPVLAGTKRIAAAVGNNVLLEALSLCFRMSTAGNHGLQIGVLESDSKSLIRALQGGAVVDASSQVIVEDIVAKSKSLGSKKTSFVRRDANRAAHYFTHFNLGLLFKLVWTDNFLDPCTRLIEDDVRQEPLNLT
ncbi:hypothetical protein ACS0TY_002983 [Phlomoides rotata]